MLPYVGKEERRLYLQHYMSKPFHSCLFFLLVSLRPPPVCDDPFFLMGSPNLSEERQKTTQEMPRKGDTLYPSWGHLSDGFSPWFLQLREETQCTSLNWTPCENYPGDTFSENTQGGKDALPVGSSLIIFGTHY